ncbi:hypothetical protein ACXDF8_22120 [Mycolicibacterium sp. CBM1]
MSRPNTGHAVPHRADFSRWPPADELAGRRLPGRDFSGALSDPTKAGVHTVRDSVLFTDSGLATNDSDAASAKLGAVIASEIGVDDGREMPQFQDTDWQIDRMDL